MPSPYRQTKRLFYQQSEIEPVVVIFYQFILNFRQLWKKFIFPPYQQIFQKHWIKMKVGKQAIFNRRPCKVISISMQMRISSAVGIFLKPKSLNIIIYNTDVFSFFWKHTTNFLNIACKQINCNISFFTPFLMSSPG